MKHSEISIEIPSIDFVNQITESIETIDSGNFNKIMVELLKKISDYLHLEDLIILYENIESGENLLYSAAQSNPHARYQEPKINLKSLPFIAKSLISKEIVKISSLDDIPPEAEFDRKYLQNNRIASLLMLKCVRDTKNFYGIFAYDLSQREWDDQTVSLISLFGKILISAFEKNTQLNNFYRSELKFRTVADNFTDVVVWRLPDGSYKYVSPSCEKLVGYTADEIIKKPALLIEKVYKADLAKYNKQIDAILESKKEGTVYFRFYIKDDEIRWIEQLWKPVFDNNQYLGFRINSRDISKRKYSMEALLQNELRFKNIFENSKIGLFRSTPDGKLLLANAAIVEMLGYNSLDELAQRNLEDEGFNPDYPREKFKKQIEKDGNVKGFESIWRRRDGSEIFVRESAVAYYDNDGNIKYYEGTVEDVTEQKKLEIDLNRIYAAVESSSESIAIGNERGYHIYHNKAASALFGYTDADDLLAAGGNTKVYKDPAIAEKLYSHIKKGKAWVGELEMVTKSGRVFTAFQKVDAIRNEKGEIIGLMAIVSDITEQKKAELKLRELELKYQTMAEYSYDIIRWLLPDGTLHYISPSCKKLTGYTLEEFMENHKLMDQIIHPDDLIPLRAWRENTMRGSRKEFEFRLIRKDEEIRWFSAGGEQIFDNEGNFLGIRTSSRDITVRKQAEIELEISNIKIKELLKELELDNLALKESVKKYSLPGIISKDPVMTKILDKVRQVAKTNSPVLIIGETGTGKELIAKAIHDLSNRNNKCLVTVNCAAIPLALIESELFGREKGAYTGALTRQIGRFQVANHSSIFLDEIGDLPSETQSKLLRVIQFGEFQRLGSPETHSTNARIIAATNKNLSVAIKEGQFREDLFYRINVFPIYLPPLRERKEDIPLLVWEFINEFSNKMGKRISEISKANMAKLIAYNWPGNIRELRNVIEYSLIISKGRSLNIEFHTISNSADNIGLTLEEVERNHILKILEKVNWKIRGENGAAKILQLNESTLRFRMKKLGIGKKNY